MYVLAAWLANSTRRDWTRVATAKVITGEIAASKTLTTISAIKDSIMVKPSWLNRRYDTAIFLICLLACFPDIMAIYPIFQPYF